MSRNHREPVRRRRVLAGTAVALALLAGIVGLAEGLRHPHRGGGPPIEHDEVLADPRVPVNCPGPEPDEGTDRPADTAPSPIPVDVSSTALLDCPEHFDGRNVRYQGEAVGGVLTRPDGAWVQVNDDVYAETVGPLPAHREYRGGNAGVGVLVPAALATEITMVGGPSTQGDLVEVVGVFRRVEPGSLEVAVVHADSLTVVRPGGPNDDPPLRDRQVAAGLLVLLAAIVVATERLVARRRLRP